MNKEAYIGRVVWNRLNYQTHPVTEKRRSRPNSADEIVISKVPELRIVPQELWDRVKARQQRVARATRPDSGPKPYWQQQRPKYLLSGLLKCSACGHSYTKCGKNRFGCVGARDKGVCSNKLTIRNDEFESAILDGLKHHLMAPDLFEEFAREFVAEINHHRQAQSQQKYDAETQLQKVKRQIDKLVDAIVNGADDLALNAKLKELEAQQATLEKELKNAPSDQPLLHPNLPTLYRQQVERLEDLLADPELGHEAIEQLRELIDRVIPVPRNGELVIELKGDLAGILACATDLICSFLELACTSLAAKL